MSEEINNLTIYESCVSGTYFASKKSNPGFLCKNTHYYTEKEFKKITYLNDGMVYWDSKKELEDFIKGLCGIPIPFKRINENAMGLSRDPGNVGYDLSIVGDGNFFIDQINIDQINMRHRMKAISTRSWVDMVQEAAIFNEENKDDKIFILRVGHSYIFSTGLQLAIPEGYAGFIWDRSGLSAKHQIHCLAGVIDSNYRGEIKVALINLSDKPYTFRCGDRIAQLIIQEDPNMAPHEVEELPNTERGDDGFGSSGR